MTNAPSFEHEPRTLWADALDNRGVLAQPKPFDDGRMHEGMNRVVSLEDSARRIGSLVTPQHANVTIEAAELNVAPDDLALIAPSELIKGLYISNYSSRFRGVRQAVRVYGGETNLNLMGVVPNSVAVVFHEDDHKRLAHSAVYIATHSSSTTRSANPVVRNSDDRAEQDRRSVSSPAKSMVSKMKSIDAFDQELNEDRDIFMRVYRAFRKFPSRPVRYRPENAQALLLQADTRLRRIVETANVQRGLDAEQRAAAQRALTHELYSSAASAQTWRSYMALAGQYVNAQRGKLDESRNACLKVYEDSRHAIKPEELAEFDAIAYKLPPQTELAVAA